MKQKKIKKRFFSKYIFMYFYVFLGPVMSNMLVCHATKILHVTPNKRKPYWLIDQTSSHRSTYIQKLCLFNCEKVDWIKAGRLPTYYFCTGSSTQQ